MYKYITLLIVIIVLFVTLNKNKDNFRSDNYRNDSVYPLSTNWRDLEQNPEKGFKYLNKKISMFDLTQEKYDNLRRVPILYFHSFESCPNLYHLFHSIIKKNPGGGIIKGEGTEGIRFRNECEKIFYNSSSFIRIEHPIIQIEGVDVPTQKQDMVFKAGYNLELNYNLNQLRPLESYPSRYLCSLENEIKQINFEVKSDFTLEDIYKFVDFCYTQLCFGMIYIEHMKLVSNHYRVFPSPAGKGSFFILPERIRHQVAKEGKYYTRAKCNTTGLNIIVLFGEHLPEKFDYIYPSSTSKCKPDLSDVNLDAIKM